MFTGYNLKINEDELNSLNSHSIDEWIRNGELRRKELESEFTPLLRDFMSDGIIDESSLSDAWFKKIRSDVFLSYSHDDEPLAMKFAGFLETKFHLKVFIDSLFWKSADKLQKEIDDCYRGEKDGYEYRDIQLSSSHVHAMLATAIAKTMDQSEVLIFLNTNNSCPKLEESVNSGWTGSPWIYEELVIASLLRPINRGQRNQMESITEAYQPSKLSIKYKLPLGNLTTINISTIEKWNDKYQKHATTGNTVYGKNVRRVMEHMRNALDVLYEITLDENDYCV